MVGAPVHVHLWLGLHTHMGGVGLDVGCVYGGIGTGRVVGSARGHHEHGGAERDGVAAAVAWAHAHMLGKDG